MDSTCKSGHHSPGKTEKEKANFDSVITEFILKNLGSAAPAKSTPAKAVAPPTTMKSCEEWCEGSTTSWDVKLTWPKCSGCEPAALMQESVDEDEGESDGQPIEYAVETSVPLKVETNGQTVKQWADIVYPSNIPAPASGWPVVILVHGKGMDKTAMQFIAKRFIKKSKLIKKDTGDGPGGMFGYCPEYNYKRATDDVRSAVKYVTSDPIVTKYSLDTSNVFIYGYSWGGQITATLLLTDAYVDSTVKGIILASAYLLKKDAAKVQSDTSVYPPTLFYHCENDWTSPFWGAKGIFDLLDPSVTEMDSTCKSGHHSPGKTEKEKANFDSVITEFILKNLGSAAPAKSTPAKAVAPPTTMKSCEEWCEGSTTSWDVKLTWPKCSGCEPAALMQESVDEDEGESDGQPIEYAVETSVPFKV